MDLRDFFNILLLVVGLLVNTSAQITEVRCINPEFDRLVDDYLDYSIPAISVADAYAKRSEYVFLDARELEEYNTSHIRGAIHVGYDQFDIATLPSNLSKSSPIIIYCSIGYRSEKIGKKLKDKGFSNVQNLYGSIFEWVNQHHIVFNLEGKPTHKIHTYNKKWSQWVDNEAIEKKW